jgi:hypothetical protein
VVRSEGLQQLERLGFQRTGALLIDLEKGRRSLLFERLYDLAAALEVSITEIVGKA